MTPKEKAINFFKNNYYQYIDIGKLNSQSLDIALQEQEEINQNAIEIERAKYKCEINLILKEIHQWLIDKYGIGFYTKNIPNEFFKKWVGK